ncbi:deoxynucleoside kinase-like isoform X1 [Varroa destructor]|uniref:Deoxynucleoside kinase domain-containing protein n=2 Tax=Varroa destructor TaxID=109461 RepID=A0A7M7L128_VARDE|nr:deoxynucleoside kinase-like isoform X1 [Varroa destructor]
MASAVVTKGLRHLARSFGRQTHFLTASRRLVQSLPKMQKLMENYCPNVSRPIVKKTNHPFIILVEGNIGSGKTTFLKQFEHLPNATVIPEPVNRWTAVGGQHNLLQLMYEEPKKYALALQTYIQLTMLQNHRHPVTTEFKLMERSLHSARYCFVENLFRSGVLSEVETLVLDEWFQHLITAEAAACKADVAVYLRTDPEVALRRIQLRARESEKTVGLDYLRSLHELHEEWFLKQSYFPLPCERIVCIDANQTADIVRDEFYRQMSRFNINPQHRLTKQGCNTINED